MIVSVVTSASFCMCFCKRKLDFYVSDIFAVSIWCLNLLLTLANGINIILKRNINFIVI